MDDEAFLAAVADDRPGLGGGDHREPAGEGLVGHDGRPLEEGGEDEDVGRRQPGRHLGVADAAEPFDLVAVSRQRAEFARLGAEELEPPAGPPRTCRQDSRRYLIPLRWVIAPANKNVQVPSVLRR